MQQAKSASGAFIKFILLAAALYLSLFFSHQFIVRRYTYYDQHFIGSIIESADFFLNLFGYHTFTILQDRDVQVIGIDGSTGVWVGSNCNAISLFSLFVVFILAYPGPIKHKVWFIPLGIILIHIANIFRVVALAMIAFHAPSYLNFNHTYTFTFLVYLFIFGLWMLWVNKFADKLQTNSNEKD
ncbi:MAG: archaeosortase/exosortase family protein [bacterium]|nr:archaeosortase/exosortase family protein [bacterium]